MVSSSAVFTNKINYKINNKSFHCNNQKYAAFNSMIFRACSISMDQKDFNEEIDYIKNIAVKNGSQIDFIGPMIRRHEKQAKKNKLTKLKQLDKNENS